MFLGYILAEGQEKMDPAKVQAVEDWLRTTGRREPQIPWLRELLPKVNSGLQQGSGIPNLSHFCYQDVYMVS